jgi:hypothetical protein
MKSYRTAMGKSVDMGALSSKNEKTRAVGNMSVNARGDTIDAHGRIIKPVTAKVNQAYSQTVGNRGAAAPSNVPRQRMNMNPVLKEELTPIERELEESFEDDIEVEKIKAQETKKK